MTNLVALMSLGFLGLASGSFGSGGPTAGKFISLLIYSPSTETKSPGVTIPIHKPSDFPFVTVVPDDGADESGGWQEAKANLEFKKFVIPVTLITWYCRITIGMPIRHSTIGYISPSSAASMSAKVTNAVTLTMDFDLPQGIFCERFFAGVKAIFPLMYPKLG